MADRANLWLAFAVIIGLRIHRGQQRVGKEANKVSLCPDADSEPDEWQLAIDGQKINIDALLLQF